MRSRAAVAIALLVVLPSLVGGVAATQALPGGDARTGTALPKGPAPVASVAASDSPDGPLDNTSLARPDPHTVIRIHLVGDGNARFDIESRYRLSDANDTAAFESFAARVAGGGVSTRYSVETFQRYADAAETATGREMEVRNGTWSKRIVNESGTRIGVLTYSFTWTEFADTGGERLRVGDAFAGRSGTWFPRLLDGQRLVISSAAPYNSVYDAPRPPDNGTISWTGPERFETGDIYVVYTSAPATTPTATPTPTPTPTPTATTPPGPGPDPDNGSGSALPMALIGLGVVILFVAVGAGGYLLAQRRTLPGDADGANGTTVAETDGEGPSAATDAGDDATISDGVPAGAGGAGAAAGDAGESDAEESVDADEEDVDVELLSDEERVERLLRNNGGRMKQGNIVSETGWSNAKVSQLLSSMDDDDRINKLRIGRENLIALPDEDIGEIE